MTILVLVAIAFAGLMYRDARRDADAIRKFAIQMNRAQGAFDFKNPPPPHEEFL